ncbi:MAG: hypothetical protein JWN68_650 [Nocardioides sp.]|nr:hypothetical protein [Nocardioides sp.]
MITGSFTAVSLSPSWMRRRSPKGRSSTRSAVRLSTHQRLEPGVAHDRYNRHPPSCRGTSTGRSKDSAPNASRDTAVTSSKFTPSVERVTTTATPRPSVSGPGTRHVSQITPSTSTALAAPAQFPGPSPGAGTTTSTSWWLGGDTVLVVMPGA